MLGKTKCRILKEIRQKIADENDIPYVTRECSFQGDCRGTCPRCERELRYLEQQLERRQNMGKAVAVTALCASLTLSAAGCSLLEDLTSTVQTTGAIEAYDGEFESSEDDTAEPRTEAEEFSIAD